MAIKQKRDFSSVSSDSRIIRWIKNNQITFINVSVTIILVGIVIIVLLRLGSTQTRVTAEESMTNLAGMIANDIQAQLLTQFDTVRNIAQMVARAPFFKHKWARPNRINRKIMP